jgi:hypothetical protein
MSVVVRALSIISLPVPSHIDGVGRGTFTSVKDVV